MKEGIPFYMKEKPKNIYDSPIAKDIIAYLNYALYENCLEDFLRIMNRPVRYIKKSTVPRQAFRMEALIQNNKSTEYVVQNIVDLYDALRFIKGLNPFSAVNFIRKGIGYEAFLKKQALENGRDAAKEIEMLEELMQLANDFETIPEWLEHIQNYDTIMREITQQENGLKSAETDAVSMLHPRFFVDIIGYDHVHL